MDPVIPPDIRVRLDSVSRSFREGDVQHAVLRDISVDVRAGDTVALRGRSGSGKSTFLNLVAGIDAPTSGTIWLDGRNLAALGDRERTLFRRRHVGFVYQSFNLIPTLSVADNVRLTLELNGVSGQRARDRVAELLKAVALEGRGASYPEVLSGGEQQRVAIARALAHRPTLLLADEPTGNLDDATALGVLELLQKLRREVGATLIMATHSAAIANSCDRQYELRGGALVALGAG